MNDDKEGSSSKSSNKKDIYIALIGVIGIIVTALFSNWDKIFPDENIVTSVYSGYQPSNNAETEIKYLLHITGAEDQMTQVQHQILEIQKQQLSGMMEDDPELLKKMYAIINDELPTFNRKIFNLSVKIQSQYFTLEEIKELNKFYSTPVMREFIRRQPAIMKAYMNEIQPIAVEFQNVLKRRFDDEILEGL